MASQNNLSPSPGSRHKRKRVGRGWASGHGRYSCRGLKGQKSRSGGGVSLRFEGGQLPLVKRLPHRRGFNNIFKKEYSVVNVGAFNVFQADSVISATDLVEAGLIRSCDKPVKVLGDGEIYRTLTIKANRFSAVAKEKIETAGGIAERI